MRVNTPTRLAAACLLAGALACAGNTARVDDDETAAARDTTSTEAPPGYRGMERDTTMAPDSAPTAVDTFLEEQGTGVPADTQGYGGLERPDTSGAAEQQPGVDTSGYGQQPGATGVDTSAYGQPEPGATGVDTSSYAQPGATGVDTSGHTGMTHDSAATDTSSWQSDSTAN